MDVILVRPHRIRRRARGLDPSAAGSPAPFSGTTLGEGQGGADPAPPG